MYKCVCKYILNCNKTLICNNLDAACVRLHTTSRQLFITQKHLHFQMEKIHVWRRSSLGRCCRFCFQATCWLDDENLLRSIYIFDDQLDRVCRTQSSQTVHDCNSDSFLAVKNTADNGGCFLFFLGVCEQLLWGHWLSLEKLKFCCLQVSSGILSLTQPFFFLAMIKLILAYCLTYFPKWRISCMPYIV